MIYVHSNSKFTAPKLLEKWNSMKLRDPINSNFNLISKQIASHCASLYSIIMPTRIHLREEAEKESPLAVCALRGGQGAMAMALNCYYCRCPSLLALLLCIIILRNAQNSRRGPLDKRQTVSNHRNVHLQDIKTLFAKQHHQRHHCNTGQLMHLMHI